jgi:hypothetical protein
MSTITTTITSTPGKRSETSSPSWSAETIREQLQRAYDALASKATPTPSPWGEIEITEE